MTFAATPAGYGSLTRTSQTVTYGGAVSISGATATVAGTATTATPANDRTFKSWTNGCGAQVTGNCTITANFEMVIRYMQDISSYKSSMAVNQQYQMVDKRDNKIYWVAKISSGVIWMTQNLDYDLSIPENQTVNAETTDFHDTWQTTNTLTPAATWDTEASINYADGGDYYLPNGTGALTAIDCSVFGNTNCHYHIGSYYSWYAAIGLTGSSQENDRDSGGSICPAGWTIPRARQNDTDDYYGVGHQSFIGLTETLGITDWRNDKTTGKSDSALLSAPLYFTRTGSYTGSGPSVGSAGAYWSRTMLAEQYYYTDYAHRLFFHESTVLPWSNTFKYVGHTVRCVAL